MDVRTIWSVRVDYARYLSIEVSSVLWYCNTNMSSVEFAPIDANFPMPTFDRLGLASDLLARFLLGLKSSL
jgi:hypothetical protein